MKKLTRRSFYKFLGLGGLCAVVSTKAINANAASKKEVKMADPTKTPAKTFMYKKVSPDKNRTCSKCVQYSGKKSAPHGPCAAFGGLNVLATGTCVAFVKDPKKA